MSASARVPGDPPSSHRAIENLIATYAELVDDGDFAGLGTLLAHATFTGSGAPVSGPDAIEKMFQDMLIVYDDGTPRTKHVTTNVIIEADEEAVAFRGAPTQNSATTSPADVMASLSGAMTSHREPGAWMRRRPSPAWIWASSTGCASRSELSHAFVV